MVVFAASVSAQETTTDSEVESSKATVNDAIIYESEGVSYTTSATRFQLTSTDKSTTVDYTEYKVDSGEFTRYTEPFTLTGDGMHFITYRSVDTVGNKEADKSFAIVIDDTAPTVSIGNEKSYVANDGRIFVPGNSEISLSAADNLSGVQVIRYGMNGGAQQDYTAPIVSDQSGALTIEYSAVDNVGNTSVAGNYSVEVDNAPPLVRIEASKPLTTVQDVMYAQRGSGFKIEASDAESGIKQVLVRLDEQGEYKLATQEIFFETSGRHVIEAKAIDNVGNESEVQRIEFMQDEEPPVTTIRAIQ